MAYIGNGPGVASQRILTTLTAVDGQTSFTPSAGYTLGYVDVFLNGVKLVDGTDYTAANGVNIVLTEAAALNDTVEVVTYFPRGLSDGYTKAEADGRYMDINAVTLPDQTSNSGKFLTTDGTNASWADVDLTDLNPTAFTVPNSATAPSNPSTGDLWYDTVANSVKHWSGSAWVQMSNKFSAAGGVEATAGGYKYHTFTTSGTLTPDGTAGEVEYLVVAGGGGGGGEHGGGGGAGGYLSGTLTLAANPYTIVVGSGGSGSPGGRPGARGGSGANSTAFGLVAVGGGGGGARYISGGAGGSGGGQGSDNNLVNLVSGTSGQGFSGGSSGGTSDPYQGGGGGGASEKGVNALATNAGGGSIATDGGDGATWLNGITYAGGGGGCCAYEGAALFGAGGAGGGGRGATGTAVAVNGSTNTGGGGGGSNRYAAASNHQESSIGPAGNGGSGIVIIRYPL